MKAGPKKRRSTLLVVCAFFVLLVPLRSWAVSPRDVAIQPSVSANALPPDRGAAGLWQSLLKLHTRASLIMFTAHPDNEDAGMLAYESRGQGPE